jgi:large subunit ribosomal protein L2
MEVYGKAGTNRRLGWRPIVRGEARNPIDHPHGGKSHGPGGQGNPAKNVWGKLAKWVPTKKKT